MPKSNVMDFCMVADTEIAHLSKQIEKAGAKIYAIQKSNEGESVRWYKARLRKEELQRRKVLVVHERDRIGSYSHLFMKRAEKMLDDETFSLISNMAKADQSEIRKNTAIPHSEDR